MSRNPDEAKLEIIKATKRCGAKTAARLTPLCLKVPMRQAQDP